MTNNIPLETANIDIWDDFNWKPSTNQLEQFIHLQSLLSNLNKNINLTRLTEGEDYWIAQVYDSIWPFQKELRQPLIRRKIIDVGSGCGFPGIAVAIVLPGSEITLIEAIKKKKEALELIINELGLFSRVEVRNERAEITGQNPFFRNKFDIAMARAVAKDSIVAEYLIPLIKLNGEGIIFKGKLDGKDTKSLNNALKILNAKISNISSINLPFNRGIRHEIRVSPIDKCPSKYPRSVGLPKKHPLS